MLDIKRIRQNPEALVEASKSAELTVVGSRGHRSFSRARLAVKPIDRADF